MKQPRDRAPVFAAQAVQLTNRSFEQGALTGWQTGGDVSVQTAAIGSDPSHGDYQALIDHGSYVRSTTSVEEHQ